MKCSHIFSGQQLYKNKNKASAGRFIGPPTCSMNMIITYIHQTNTYKHQRQGIFKSLKVYLSLFWSNLILLKYPLFRYRQSKSWTVVVLRERTQLYNYTGRLYTFNCVPNVFSKPVCKSTDGNYTHPKYNNISYHHYSDTS